MVTLDATRYSLPDLVEWPAGDSRELNFTVETNGAAKDLSDDTITWHLLEKPYDALGDAVLSGDDPGVDVEFRVDITGGATSGLWGSFTQRIEIDPPGDDTQTFAGDVILEDIGD